MAYIIQEIDPNIDMSDSVDEVIFWITREEVGEWWDSHNKDEYDIWWAEIPRHQKRIIELKFAEAMYKTIEQSSRRISSPLSDAMKEISDTVQF